MQRVTPLQSHNVVAICHVRSNLVYMDACYVAAQNSPVIVIFDRQSTPAVMECVLGAIDLAIFNKTGLRIYAVEGNTLTCHGVETGKVEWTYSSAAFSPSCLALSFDQSRLFAGTSNGEICAFCVVTGRLLTVNDIECSPFTAVFPIVPSEPGLVAYACNTSYIGKYDTDYQRLGGVVAASIRSVSRVIASANGVYQVMADPESIFLTYGPSMRFIRNVFDVEKARLGDVTALSIDDNDLNIAIGTSTGSVVVVSNMAGYHVKCNWNDETYPTAERMNVSVSKDGPITALTKWLDGCIAAAHGDTVTVVDSKGRVIYTLRFGPGVAATLSSSFYSAQREAQYKKEKEQRAKANNKRRECPIF